MNTHTLTQDEWHEVVSFLDIPSLLSTRQTCTSLFLLINKDDILWRRFFPYQSITFTPCPTIHQLISILHKISQPTPTKLQYITYYMTIKSSLEGKEIIFANAYNNILSSGFYGMAWLTLPFFLSVFFPLPLVVHLCLCTICTLLGCTLMVKCVWEHVRKVCEYHKDTKERLSWIRYQRFALHSWYTSLFRIFILAAFMFNLLVSPTAAITSLLHPVIELWFYFFMIMFGVGYFIYGYQHIRKYIFASLYSLMLALWLLSWRIIPFLLILLIHPFLHSAINNGLYHSTTPPNFLPPLPNSYLLPLFSILPTILPALLVYPITSSLSSELQLSDHFFVAFIILHSTVSALALVFFGVYKLMTIGYYRWWWISFLCPFFSALIVIKSLPYHVNISTTIVALLYCNFVGLMCHDVVMWNLIGIAESPAMSHRVQHPRIITLQGFG